jgi:predicted nucleic acid-binding protein
MSATDAFFDTNLLLYLLSEDAAKADRAEALLAAGGAISVQVLNEFASVAIHKLKMRIAEVREVLATIRAVCDVKPVDIETHELALDLVERYRFSVYDSLILAAAALAGCAVLYTEDLGHRQRIDGIRISNPFVGD